MDFNQSALHKVQKVRFQHKAVVLIRRFYAWEIQKYNSS